MDEQTPTPSPTNAGTAHTMDMLNRELVSWFVSRGGSWSGTASELLVHLKNAANVSEQTFPTSASLLCDHLEAHAANLRFLGVEATVRQGAPRTVSLKRCPRDTASEENVQTPSQRPEARSASSPEVATRAVQDVSAPAPEVTESSAAKLSQSAADLDSEHDDRQTASELASAMREITQIAKRVRGHMDHSDSQSQIAGDDELKQTPAGGFTGPEGTPDAQSSGPVLEPPLATGELFEPVFDNTGEALFSILELQKQMKLNDHPNTILSGVAKAAEQMAKASGVTICLLQNDALLYESETGTVIKALPGESGLLAGCARSGAISQIEDVESDPRVSPECSRQGIQSVIVSPFTLANGFVGAIAFCFKEKRSIHSADILTLQMFSDAINAAMNGNGIERISEISADTDPEPFFKRRTA